MLKKQLACAIHLYMALTILGGLVFVFTPTSIWHFTGASPIFYIFMLAFEIANKVARRLALLCILGYFLMLLISYFFAWGKGKISLFYSTIATGLVISTSCAIYKICVRNYLGLELVLAGILTNFCYLAWLLYLAKKQKSSP